MHPPYFNYLKRHCIAQTLKVLLFRQMHRYFDKSTCIFRQTKTRHLANFIWRKTIWRKTKNKLDYVVYDIEYDICLYQRADCMS